MRIKQLISRIVMALIITFGVQTTASAQFGSLKGLAKKAKQAVTDKAKETVSDAKKDAKTTVKQQATQTVSETTGVNVGSDGDETSAGDVTESLSDFDVDYSIAKQTTWDYESPTTDVLADAAYWCQRLRNSLKAGKAGAIDFDALSHINNGVPSFSYLEKQYHQGSDARNLEAVWQWGLERDQLVKAAWKLISKDLPQRPDYAGMVKGLLSRAEKAGSQSARNYYFDRAFETTSLAIKFGKISAGNSDASSIASRLQALYSGLDATQKANYPSSFTVSDIEAFDEKRIAGANVGGEQLKMKKGSLMRSYKRAEAEGRYKAMPASKGSQAEQGIKAYIEKTYPEWGKLVRVSCAEQWNVVRDKLGNIQYRYCGASILCEDQGYKVIHGVDVHQTYSGGKYENRLVRNDAWNNMIYLAK